MKFKIIDREKRGFAKYCPTFARAYQVMAEKIRRRRLVKGLDSEDANVRKATAWALTKAVCSGVDITVAVGALGKALADEDIGVRLNVAQALWNVAEQGMDVSDAVDALGKALVDDDLDVRQMAAGALGYATVNEKTREAAVREILKFMNSSWFMQEAEKNSDAFIDVVDELDEVLRRVKAIEAEREVA